MLALCSLLLATTATKLPNIVILYADDMGYGDLAVQNPESKIPTPNIDRLAREGMRFTDGHSSSGICTPSRYALLTGRYHWRDFHGIVGSFGPTVFKEGQLTMAEMLREQGYATACIGKWHLGWDWPALMEPGAKAIQGQGYPPTAFDWSKSIPDGPLDEGFDTYFGDDVPNFPPYTWIRDDKVVIAPSGPLKVAPVPPEGSAECRLGPMAEGWRLDEVMPRLTEEALAYIDSRRGQNEPFFLYFPFTSPHAPIVPTEDWLGRTEAGPYGDFVAQTDWTIGQVLRALDRNRFADNTIVIFTADNGPEIYAYERFRKYGHASMGELRGIKRDIWEGGHRVPFVVRWPGVVTPGTVSNALITQVDLVATVASIVGYELKNTEDSLDQTPVLRGDMREVRNVIVHNTYKDHYAIRHGDWVLLENGTGNERPPADWFAELRGYGPPSPPYVLYRLSDDLGQINDLYRERPVKARMMQRLLDQIRDGRMPQDASEERSRQMRTTS